jgi:putative sigma-54 modulation protein
MRLELTGRHVDITPPIRRLVEGKLAKLERMLNDSAVSAQVVLTRQKHLHRADITLHARGENFFHGVGAAAGWEASMTGAIDKLAQQAHKVKGKWKARKRQSAKGVPMVGEEPVAVRPAESPRGGAGSSIKAVRPRMPRVMRTSRQPVREMSIADAARELDADGDGVVVFRDAQTAALSILYRRRGELTLVETEA